MPDPATAFGVMGGNEAARLLLNTLLLGALGTGSATFLSRLLYGGAQRLKARKKDYDIDIDIPVSFLRPGGVSEELMEELREQRQPQLKVAEVQPDPLKGEIRGSRMLPLYILAALGGVGAGVWGGEVLGDKLANAGLRRKMKKAKEDFEKALMEERLAALASPSSTPFAPYGGMEFGQFKTAALKKKGVSRFADLAKAIALGYTIPSGVLSYLFFKDYFAKKDVDKMQYRKALKALDERLKGEMPFAQLTHVIPGEERSRMKELLAVQPEVADRQP
jgi:hypothetical protein